MARPEEIIEAPTIGTAEIANVNVDTLDRLFITNWVKISLQFLELLGLHDFISPERLSRDYERAFKKVRAEHPDLAEANQQQLLNLVLQELAVWYSATGMDKCVRGDIIPSLRDFAIAVEACHITGQTPPQPLYNGLRMISLRINKTGPEAELYHLVRRRFLRSRESFPIHYQDVPDSALGDCRVDLLIDYAQQAADDGDPGQALRFERELQRRKPGNLIGRYRIIDCLIELERFDEAEKEIEEAEELIRDSADRDAGTIAIHWRKLTQARRGPTKLPDSHRDVTDEMLSLCTFRKLKVYVGKARAAADASSALRFHRELVRRRPQDVRGLINLALTLEDLKQWPEALKVREQIEVLLPGDARNADRMERDRHEIGNS